MDITRNTWIEDLVEQNSEAVQYLADKGIKCIACGEPVWGSLEEAAKEKGYSDEEIGGIVRDLKAL